MQRLAEVKEDAKPPEITFLVNETGIDRQHLKTMMLAAQHQYKRETGVSAEALCGWFREGLPRELEALAGFSSRPWGGRSQRTHPGALPVLGAIRRPNPC